MKSTNIKKYLRRLQKMTIDENISDIKEYLNSLNKKLKGTIWEYYIREL